MNGVREQQSAPPKTSEEEKERRGRIQEAKCYDTNIWPQPHCVDSPE